jgi:caffeoyl-CoA O-methyltransferase
MKQEFLTIVNPSVADYAKVHTTPETDILRELNHETYNRVPHATMLSGPLLGKLLQMLSLTLRPEKILEIGTFTGYSAITMAAGLAEGGIIHTIDISIDLEAMIRRYIRKAGLEDKIILHFGPALEIIPTLDEVFDMVFIDADKENYPNYYRLVIDKVIDGGIIVADNALWDGQVLHPDDEETWGIAKFNDLVQNDERVDNILLTVGDGVMVIRKKILRDI